MSREISDKLWDTVTPLKLSDVATVTSGKRIPKGYQLQNECTKYSQKYLRVVDMTNFDINALMYVPDEVVDKIKRYRIFENDIYIVCVGNTLGVVGKISKELSGINLTENANRISNFQGDINFLVQYLQSPKIKKIIDAKKTTGAQPKIALERIRNFPVPNIDYKRQVKIGTLLSSIDELIERTNLQLLLNQKLRKSYLDKIFYSNQYNEHLLGTKKLGELFIIESIGIDKIIDPNENQVKMINYLDVYRGIVNEENLSYTSAGTEKIKKTLVQKDDILITPTSETPTDIFNSFVVRKNFESDVVYSYHLTKLSPRDKTNSNFTKLYFDTIQFRREVSKYATGSTRFTLSKNDIANLVVPIYDNSFQKEITMFFDKYDEIEANTLQMLEQYKLMKQFHLNNIFK